MTLKRVVFTAALHLEPSEELLRAQPTGLGYHDIVYEGFPYWESSLAFWIDSADTIYLGIWTHRVMDKL